MQFTVASLGLVSAGAATDGITPIFPFKKTDDLFSLSLQSDDLFSCRLITTPQLPSSNIVLYSVL